MLAASDQDEYLRMLVGQLDHAREATRKLLEENESLKQQVEQLKLELNIECNTKVVAASSRRAAARCGSHEEITVKIASQRRLEKSHFQALGKRPGSLWHLIYCGVCNANSLISLREKCHAGRHSHHWHSRPKIKNK